MTDLTDFISEQYNPAFNKDHNKALNSVMKMCEKLIKNGMKKEDVIAMLDDIKASL